MTLRIVVCHISFPKFEYFTQRRREAEYAEAFTTQILIITLTIHQLTSDQRAVVDLRGVTRIAWDVLHDTDVVVRNARRIKARRLRLGRARIAALKNQDGSSVGCTNDRPGRA